MNNTIKTIGNDFEVIYSTPKTEKCVVCGVNTGILESTPIEFRDNYIEGAGQLCNKCYNGSYKSTNYTDNCTIGEL